MIFGHNSPAVMQDVPARVHANDRHLVAAALVLIKGLTDEDQPDLHKVLIVSNNTRHLAITDTR